MREKNQRAKVLSAIIVLLLPLIIEETCKICSESFYCKNIAPFIEFSEPPNNHLFNVVTLANSSINSAVSGTTTTILPQI
jgi:hypothetical protein